MLEGARQRETTAKANQEREAALQKQLQAAESHTEELCQQLVAAQEASRVAEAVKAQVQQLKAEALQHGEVVDTLRQVDVDIREALLKLGLPLPCSEGTR